MIKRVILDLAVVTSCHNYGRYIDDWARSLIEMTVWPRRVVLIDNGSTDRTWALMNDAADKLREAGLPEVLVERIPLADFGTARNHAVALGGDTEWVMHMDADDMFMPHCLADASALMPKADVIPLGYQRSGDLSAGPRNRTRVYSNSQGFSTLQSIAPASGVSPFRRAFWERSPYRTDMIGGWDTALWIGFAHLDARFVATRRPCFYYRQHADSIFNARRLHRRRGRVVGAQLMNLRRQRAGVSILVPRRGDGGGSRDVSWSWIAKRYAALYPEWEVVEADCGPGEWRKGEAVSAALEKSRGNTIIIADSDCILPAEALCEAVQLVENKQAPWVIPHTLVKRLNRAASDAVLDMDPSTEPPFLGTLDRKEYVGYAGGGFIVVDASAWQASGGMPHAFAGWGAEDEATAVILDTLVGPHVRLEYDLWHLWHPHAAKASSEASLLRNRNLFRTIASMAGNEDVLFDLVERLGAGLSVEVALATAGGGGVLMVALMDFRRGTEIIKRHSTFVATEEEARRHESRPRRIASRANGGAGLAATRNRALQLRAEQHVRNLGVQVGAEARIEIPGVVNLNQEA